MLKHEPALLKEVFDYLQPKPNQNFVDCTYGSGGHALEILKYTAPEGKVLGIDLAVDAPLVRRPTGSGSGMSERLIVIKGNFRDLQKIAEKNNFKDVSGILLDLGVSSMQLDDKEKGFGFQSDKLDMRFDKNQTLTAKEIVNHWPADKLVEIFRAYGEERLAKPIAKAVADFRKKQMIEKPMELAEIARDIYHHFYRKSSKINPATKVFQALRIAVNNELNNLEQVLPQAVAILKPGGPSVNSSRLGSRSATGPGGLSVNSGPGGRLVVIAYHSLEDKIVKEFFRRESRGCICPPELLVQPLVKRPTGSGDWESPDCQCNHRATLKIITKKPVVSSEAEIAKNPRARSAKMRVGEKI